MVRRSTGPRSRTYRSCRRAPQDLSGPGSAGVAPSGPRVYFCGESAAVQLPEVSVAALGATETAGLRAHREPRRPRRGRCNTPRMRSSPSNVSTTDACCSEWPIAAHRLRINSSLTMRVVTRRQSANCCGVRPGLAVRDSFPGDCREGRWPMRTLALQKWMWMWIFGIRVTRVYDRVGSTGVLGCLWSVVIVMRGM